MNEVLNRLVDKLSYPKSSSHFDRTRDPPHQKEPYQGTYYSVANSLSYVSLNQWHM
jgi:hypothetical protein